MNGNRATRRAAGLRAPSALALPPGAHLGNNTIELTPVHDPATNQANQHGFAQLHDAMILDAAVMNMARIQHAYPADMEGDELFRRALDQILDWRRRLPQIVADLTAADTPPEPVDDTDPED